MKMVASVESQLRMLVVHARGDGGFFIALVPAALLQEQVESAPQELSIDAVAVLELSEWRTRACGITLAYVLPMCSAHIPNYEGS
jgi:hypothetical protein